MNRPVTYTKITAPGASPELWLSSLGEIVLADRTEAPPEMIGQGLFGSMLKKVREKLSRSLTRSEARIQPTE